MCLRAPISRRGYGARIDAPELKAACPQELQMAEAASSALRDLLSQKRVVIFHVGPDKYTAVRR